MKSVPAFRTKRHHLWGKLKEEFAWSDFWPSLPTALLCWFLTVIFSVSLAALIFRGPIEPYLALGISMSLLTATTVGLFTTILGSLPGTIAIPSDRTAPMLGILTAAIASSFPAGTSADVMIQTCLAGLVLTTFLTGITLALLGHYRLGRLVRFLPLPVVGGFMAGAGWLMIKGGMTVLIESDAKLSDIPHLFQPHSLVRWLPAVGMAILLVLANRRVKHFLVIPVVVVTSVAIFYFIAWLEGAGPTQLRALQWLPGPFPKATSWQPISLHLVLFSDWARIFENAYTIATILIVSATSLLMISSAMEFASDREVDADRELEAAGLANLAAVIGGGLVGFHSLSITSLALRIGPISRWVGLFTAIGSGLTLLIGPSLVSYLPIPVMGGLLLFLGFNFLMEWLVDARRRMPRSDYLIIVAILLTVAWAGYLVGVGVGLLLAVGLFVLRYSRIDIVRLELSGSQHRSNVDRTPEEQEILRPLRSSILILKLQGFIFFGTAHSLLSRARRRAHDAELPPLKYLFMDFRHVTGLDSSTLLSFSRLLQSARQLDFQVILTSVPLSILHSLQRDQSLFKGDGFILQPDMDYGMEWCETQTLLPHREKLSPQSSDVANILQSSLPEHPEIAGRILHYFGCESAVAGTVLAVQGEHTRDLFLIQVGQVSAVFKSEHGESIRLRTMGPGSVVGEIGLYLNLPRTASLIVDTPSLIWTLPPEALRLMEKEDPQAASALHEYLARMVANRLVQANALLETTLR